MNYKENNCIFCGDLYKYDSRQKVSKYCSTKCSRRYRGQLSIKGEIGIDYVECEICNLKFKEINNDHLKLHNITSSEYDEKYGHNKRTSDKSRGRKDTLSSIMTPELSKKLSKSHTIEGFIDKYGEEEGRIKYQSKIDNFKYSRSKEAYIKKYGDIEGDKLFSEIQGKKAMTIDNLIRKHGEEEGIIRYNKWIEIQKVKNTLPHFINIYGYEKGLSNWLDKNDKISLANSKIIRDDRKSFINYAISVNKFTRISLSMNNLIMLELRGKENGYDLDHIFSKVDGFKNKIPPYIIGHISNLRVIDSSENRKKQHRSDIDINEIVALFNKDKVYKKLINDILNN